MLLIFILRSWRK